MVGNVIGNDAFVLKRFGKVLVNAVRPWRKTAFLQPGVIAPVMTQ